MHKGLPGLIIPAKSEPVYSRIDTMENTKKLSYFKGADTPGLINETIGERLAKTVQAFPERDGLIVRHQGIRWTYAEYAAEIEKLATGLLALGIVKGDRVGIWAPNCYEWCLTQFATARIGAILVNVNPAYRVFELEYALNKSGCSAITSVAPRLDMAVMFSGLRSR